MCMKNRDFGIGVKALWVLEIGSLLLILLGSLAKIQHWEYGQLLLSSGLMFFFITWILVLTDLTRNQIYQKGFWMLILFIMPPVATLFYFVQRNRLLRLGEKFS